MEKFYSIIEKYHACSKKIDDVNCPEKLELLKNVKLFHSFFHASLFDHI
jgi:hypothetical protein